MGTKYEVKCEDCGYRAVVSGGRDVGMMAVVETMTCDDCKELVDVLIGRFGQEGQVGDSDSDSQFGMCPQCDGKKVVPWGEARPCPRCGSTMVPGDLIVNWD